MLIFAIHADAQWRSGKYDDDFPNLDDLLWWPIWPTSRSFSTDIPSDWHARGMAALAAAESSAAPTQVADGLRDSDNRLFGDRVCQRPQFGLFRVRIISNDPAGNLCGDGDRVNERSGSPIPVPHTQHYSNAIALSPERFLVRGRPKNLVAWLSDGQVGQVGVPS